MFFNQISEFLDSGDITMSIRKKDDVLTVSILPQSSKAVVPLVLSGTVEDLDAEFFNTISSPLKKYAGITSNTPEFEKSISEGVKGSKSSKASPKDGDDDYDNWDGFEDDEKPAKKSKKASKVEAAPKAEAIPEPQSEPEPEVIPEPEPVVIPKTEVELLFEWVEEAVAANDYDQALKSLKDFSEEKPDVSTTEVKNKLIEVNKMKAKYMFPELF